MKRTILIFIVLAGLITNFAYSQNDVRALGYRSSWVENELSYQNPIKTNRIEIGLGWHDDRGISATGIYQWLFDLSKFKDGLNWYVGTGIQIGSWNLWFWDEDISKEDKYEFAFGIVGQVGIEYNFDIPLQISLDFRPGLYLLPSDYGGSLNGVGIGLRYKF